MAGLVAAARARELGAEPLVLEKGDRAGGSMLLSSGVIWRHRTFEGFRAECPGGDPVLQKIVFELLDEAIEWLESLGAPVLEHETGNPRTVGKRFDTRGLTDALHAREPDRSHCAIPWNRVWDLATGAARSVRPAGFHVRLARELGLPIRGNPWSEGDGLDLALERGGETGRRARRVLRPRDARRDPDRRGGVRPALAALRAVRRGRLRGRHAAVRGRGLVVGDEPRPGDRALAGWSRVVPRPREPARGSACASERSRT